MNFLGHAAKLVVELDGATHSAELRRDGRRDRWFEANGFLVLRFTNGQVYAELKGVLEAIRLRAEERLPPPQRSPLRGRATPESIPVGSLPSPAQRARAGEGACVKRSHDHRH